MQIPSTRRRNGFDQEDRVNFIDEYLRASPSERRQLLRRYHLKPAVPNQWANSIYGQGLRDLRRVLHQ